jgi:hypothetical protein
MFAAIPVSYSGDRVAPKRTAKTGAVMASVKGAKPGAVPAKASSKSGSPSVMAVKTSAKKPDVAQAPRKTAVRKPAAVHTPGA